MAVLERERRLLVREPEFLGGGERRDHLRGRHPRPDHRDRTVEDVPTALVRVHLRPGRAADGERPVVAGAVAVEGVEDVEIGGVTGAQHPVGEDVRVRAAALAGDRVHALDVLRAELVEDAVHEGDAVVFAHSGTHRAEELLVCGIDHGAGRVQQDDLVAGLELTSVLHEGLSVDDRDPGRFEGTEHR